MSLPCLTPLKHNESLISFIHRLEDANCYERRQLYWFLLTKVDGGSLLPPHPSVLQKTSELTRLSTQQLYDASYSPVAKRIGQAKNLYYTGRKTAFCPDCLREDNYHRKWWGFKAIRVCTKHCTKLVDSCPQCNHPISIYHLVDGKCSFCYYQLSESPTIHIKDEAILNMQSTIQNWLRVDRASATNGLPNLPTPTLWRTWHTLKRGITQIRHSWDYVDFDFPVTDLEDLNVQLVAFQALQNWPYKFREFINAYKTRDGLESKRKLNQLGTLMTLLESESIIKDEINECFPKRRPVTKRRPNEQETYFEKELLVSAIEKGWIDESYNCYALRKYLTTKLVIKPPEQGLNTMRLSDLANPMEVLEGMIRYGLPCCWNRVGAIENIHFTQYQCHAISIMLPHIIKPKATFGMPDIYRLFGLRTPKILLEWINAGLIEVYLNASLLQEYFLLEDVRVFLETYVSEAYVKLHAKTHPIPVARKLYRRAELY